MTTQSIAGKIDARLDNTRSKGTVLDNLSLDGEVGIATRFRVRVGLAFGSSAHHPILFARAFTLGMALVLSVGLAIGTTACGAFQKDYPEKRQYLIQVDRAGAPRDGSAASVLIMRPFRISPAYEGRQFVIRREETRYETDFYNEFLVAPARNLGEQTETWMGRSGLFGQVVSATGLTLPTFALEANAAALYGDYSGDGAAVLKLQFTLTDMRQPTPKTLMHKDYEANVKIDEKNASPLVSGWNAGLADILKRVEEDVAAALAADS